PARTVARKPASRSSPAPPSSATSSSPIPSWRCIRAAVEGRAPLQDRRAGTRFSRASLRTLSPRRGRQGPPAPGWGYPRAIGPSAESTPVGKRLPSPPVGADAQRRESRLARGVQVSAGMGRIMWKPMCAGLALLAGVATAAPTTPPGQGWEPGEADGVTVYLRPVSGTDRYEIWVRTVLNAPARELQQ